jgi:hypothetical protein
MSDVEKRQEPPAGSLYSIELDDVQGPKADLFAM